jgi:prepilin-type N-terminal cleavage/methylation domain-containing protein
MRSPAFTLVELIVSMVVLATLASMSALLVAQAGRTLGDSRERSRSAADAAWAVDRILAAIRTVPEAQAGVPGILAATTTSLDLTGGLTIALDGDAVVMDDGAGPEPLCGGVSEFALEYFDLDGQPLDPEAGADPADIRRVLVHLVARGVELRGAAVPRAGFGWRPSP